MLGRTTVWITCVAVLSVALSPAEAACQEPLFCISSCYDHGTSMRSWGAPYLYGVSMGAAPPEALCFIDNAVQTWLDACEGYYSLDIGLAGSDCHPYAGTTYAEAVADDTCDSILWLDDWGAANEPPEKSGISRVRFVSDEVFGADIFLNNQWFAWGDMCVGRPPIYGTEDIESLLLHEIGHTLMLKHVSGWDCSQCVMAGPFAYFTGDCYRVLGLGDKWGSCLLYGGTGIGDLKSFQVSAGDGYVDAVWEMWTSGTYAFELYAHEPGQPFVEVYSGTLSGDSFSFRDSEVLNGASYGYILWVDDGFTLEQSCSPAGAPPLCSLDPLSCEEVSDGIRLGWTTTVESPELQGFHVYREEGWAPVGNGARYVGSGVKVTTVPIPPLGTGGGSYQFTDVSALHGRKYSYTLRATSDTRDERWGPACNPCWRPYLPLCSVSFAAGQDGCPLLCPAGCADPGNEAPLEVVVTVKDSCGFPIEGTDAFHVRCQSSVGGNFGLCCAQQQPTVHSPWVMLPDDPTDANGVAAVPIWWAAGRDTALTVSVYLEEAGILPQTLQTQVRSPDMNGDCVVDLVDFVEFSTQYGTNAWQADFDCDGVVGLTDFIAFSAHHGHECGSARTLPIPPEFLARLGMGDWSDVATDGFSASPNTPNPFNPVTHISYEVPNRGAHVSIAVFDLAGRRVKVLVDDEMSAGEHQVTWDATNEQGQEVPSGVYFYRVEAPGFVDRRKMVLIK